MKQVQLLARYRHHGEWHARGTYITLEEKDASDLVAIGFARVVVVPPTTMEETPARVVKGRYNRRDMRAKTEE